MKIIASFLFVIIMGANHAVGFSTESPPDVTNIVFTSKWEEIVQGNLTPGKPVRITYDPKRLPGRDTRYGQRAWDIFAEIKFSNWDDVQSIKLGGPDEVSRMMSTLIVIPFNATKFIIWFKHWGYYSGYSYDSDYGKNYEFSFNQIVFTGSWDEYVNGRLYPGERFDVLYTKSRLPWNDTYLGMGRAWVIFAEAKFSEDGPVVKKRLEGPVGEDKTMSTRFVIPADAQEVIMWFFFRGYIHNIRYDSNQGENYHFKLSQ